MKCKPTLDYAPTTQKFLKAGSVIEIDRIEEDDTFENGFRIHVHEYNEWICIDYILNTVGIPVKELYENIKIV